MSYVVCRMSSDKPVRLPLRIPMLLMLIHLREPISWKRASLAFDFRFYCLLAGRTMTHIMNYRKASRSKSCASFCRRSILLSFHSVVLSAFFQWMAVFDEE